MTRKEEILKERERLEKRARLENQYLYEKSVLEMYGYSSVITFEEWLEIKNIKL